MSSASARELDVIVWGASGFTGKLVAEYLLSYYHDKVKFAIAGRDNTKLVAVRDSLAKDLPQAKDLRILTASLDDESSMVELAKKAQVVISTVGPFARYGTPVVAACVEAGTNYVDITGEVQWTRKVAQLYHEKAAAKGIKLVSCCGFDSIPSDLGTFHVVNYMKNNLKLQCGRVDGVFTSMKGAASGGTVASMFEMVETTNWEEKKGLVDPYWYQEASSLSTYRHSLPADQQKQFDQWQAENRAAQSRPHIVGYSTELQKYTAPFLMSVVNSKVVYRSASLLPEVYGPHFSYAETKAYSRGWVALLVSVVFYFVSFLVLFAPIRTLLKKVLPKPGEGPTKEQRDAGHFTFKAVGESIKGADGKSVKVVSTVVGKKDPGYGVTCRMVTESALCFVFNRQELSPRGGYLTPASAFGSTLIDRLNSSPSEMSFSISPLDK